MRHKCHLFVKPMFRESSETQESANNFVTLSVPMGTSVSSCNHCVNRSKSVSSLSRVLDGSRKFRHLAANAGQQILTNSHKFSLTFDSIDGNICVLRLALRSDQSPVQFCLREARISSCIL
jgi:hypothetical protein